MLKGIHPIIIIVISTAILLACANFTPALADQSRETPPAGEAVEKPRPFPFRGRIHTIDLDAKTITLEGREKNRVVHLTRDTKILKGGNPAKLEDAILGEEIAGQVLRRTDGDLEAVSLRFGPKVDEPPRRPARSKD
jgi:hypothetical protein